MGIEKLSEGRDDPSFDPEGDQLFRDLDYASPKDLKGLVNDDDSRVRLAAQRQIRVRKWVDGLPDPADEISTNFDLVKKKPK